MSLLHEQQVTLIAGKGGVGRTSFAYAYAWALSQFPSILQESQNTKTPTKNFLLLFHPSSHLLEPIPNTEIVELNGYRGQELFLKSALKIEQLVQFAVHSPIIHKIREATPSFQELGIFYQFLSLYRQNPTSRFILDLPATGHTQALISLPEILLKIIPVGPIAKLLKEGQSILYDQKKTKAHVLTLAEELPIQEAIDLIAILRRYCIPIGNLIINRNLELPTTEIPNSLLNTENSSLLWMIQKQIRANEFIQSKNLDVQGISKIQLPEFLSPDLAQSSSSQSPIFKQLGSELLKMMVSTSQNTTKGDDNV